IWNLVVGGVNGGDDGGSGGIDIPWPKRARPPWTGVFATPTSTTTTSHGARRWVLPSKGRSTSVSCQRLKTFWDGNRKSSGFPYVVNLESGDLESKAHSAKYWRDCRIFHLDLVGRCGDEESEVAIELGCSCKGNHDRALPSLSSGRRGRNREI
ncbi:hypothetical protein U1Q18_047557, partial [Sarracenia purpurea var. burkii]